MFGNENFDACEACAGVRQRAPKLWIWTSKIMPDLLLLDLFCPIKTKFHTHPNGDRGWKKEHGHGGWN